MIPGGVRIFVCTEPVDMRYGFDRLAATARSRLGEDPQQGAILVAFANRGATRLKLLWFDRNGYCLLYKRLHGALFVLPRAGDGAPAVRRDGVALGTLLAGVESRRTGASPPRRAVGRKNWIFVGSEDGARVNTIFVSLLASCAIHRIEPWAYLRDLFCLLPSWPITRVLELAPVNWPATLQVPTVQAKLAANIFRTVTLLDPQRAVA